MALAGGALAQSSTNYDLSWHVVGSGGGTMSSTNYAMAGTVGQAIAGDVESANYALQSQGYWGPVPQTEPGPEPQYQIYLPLAVRAGA
jgi:hypothetical protein